MSWPGLYRRAQRSTGFTLVELLLVVSIIAILVAIALPNYVKIKDKAKEAEVKANLHNIQTVLERFAVDNEGWYPPYLIGGDNEWIEINRQSKDIREEVHEISHTDCSDPLLRFGYLESYPRNPFIKDGLSVIQFQTKMGDPLRSSFPPGRKMGTRFGAYGNVMGQTLCDARWLTWTYHNRKTGKSYDVNTWSNVQYEFYDVWTGNLRRPHLPGSFLYKSFGEVLPTDATKRDQAAVSTGRPIISINPEETGEATIPLTLSSYMLGAWGGSRTKGMDLLGEEPLVFFTVQRDGNDRLPETDLPYIPPIFGTLAPNGPIAPPASGSKAVQVYGVPPWTRGVNRTHVGPLWGSPYGPAQASGEQLSFGNPNGFKDSIILWLGPGSDD